MSDHGHGGHHIVGPATYLKNLLFLMTMMVLTVAVAGFHIGPKDSQAMNLIVALIIAFAKMGAILLIFMHVKYSSNLVRIVSVIAFAFMVIFFSFTFADFSTRDWHSTFAADPYTGVTVPHAPGNHHK